MKSRGRSPRCGGLSLMGGGGLQALVEALRAVAVTLPRIGETKKINKGYV